MTYPDGDIYELMQPTLTFSNPKANTHLPLPKQKNKTRRGARHSNRLRKAMAKHSGGRKKPRWLMPTIMECNTENMVHEQHPQPRRVWKWQKLKRSGGAPSSL